MKHLVLAGLMAMSLNAIAGDKGNGGGSHFCSQRSSQELYDVFEGRTRYGLEINLDENQSIESYLTAAVNKVKRKNPTLALKIREGLDYLNSAEAFIVIKDIELTPIPDANILMKKKGCEYRQLANWDDVTGKVFVDEEIYNRLSNMHKAGLKLHEAIYVFGRKAFSHINSDLTRRFVAEILSDEEEMETLANFSKANDFIGDEELSRTSLKVSQTEAGLLDVGIEVLDSNPINLKNYSLKVNCTDESVEKIKRNISQINSKIEELKRQLEVATRNGQRKLRAEIKKLQEQTNVLGYDLTKNTLDSLCSHKNLPIDSSLVELKTDYSAYGGQTLYGRDDYNVEARKVTLDIKLLENGEIIDQVITVAESKFTDPNAVRTNSSHRFEYRSIKLKFTKKN